MRRVALPGVTDPSLPLSPGVVAGNLVFVSGQVPRRRDGTWVDGPIEEQVACVLNNVEAVLSEAGSSLAKLCSVRVYLTHPEDFAAFNDFYRARLGKHGFPARTTLVTSLVTPPEVRIEVDVVAELE
jgi:2-iminobutanoate/2-iminopropanoate deaminase